MLKLQKPYATRELRIVTKNGGCVLLCLACGQAGWQADQNSSYGDFFYVWQSESAFLLIMLYLMNILAKKTLIFFLKMIFITYDVSRMIFKGGILSSASHYRDDPYLNSTTVLFD